MENEAQPDLEDASAPAPTVRLIVRSAITGEIEFELPAAAFLRICWSLPPGKDGYQHAMEMAQFGAWLVKQSDLSTSEIERLRTVFAAFYHYAEREQWTTRLDPLLSACYHMLRDKLVTRRGAAEFASQQLNEYVDPEAWRKRVDRWAMARGLPPVAGQRLKTSS